MNHHDPTKYAAIADEILSLIEDLGFEAENVISLIDRMREKGYSDKLIKSALRTVTDDAEYVRKRYAIGTDPGAQP